MQGNQSPQPGQVQSTDDDPDMDAFHDNKIDFEMFATKSIINSQEALKDPDLKQGLTRFRVMIEDLQIITQTKMTAEEITAFEKSMDDERIRLEALHFTEDIIEWKLSLFKKHLLLKFLFRERNIKISLKV